MELMIYAGGRWRSVCGATGRVSGWRRRARLAVRRGQELREVAASELLRMLRPGPPLPAARRPRLSDTKSKFKTHVRHPPSRPTKYDKSSKVEKPARSVRDCCIQTDLESEPAAIRPAQNTDRPQQQHVTDYNRNTDNFNGQKIRKPEQSKRSADESTDSLTAITNEKKKKEVQESELKSENFKKSVVRPSIESQTTCREDSQCKELIINEEDVMLLRRFIGKHNTNINLEKFDTDEKYKMRVFYKINPLVRVERSQQISIMLRERESLTTTQFARQLGLRSVAESSTESEQRPRTRRSRKQRAMEISSGSSSDLDFHQTWTKRIRRSRADSNMENKKPKTKSVMPEWKRNVKQMPKRVCTRRDYSAREDQVIVSWLSAAEERERCVNGNRVWRQLQAAYERLAGNARTWHSLRNRFLRYILPGLSALRLSAAHAQRLRTNAALGELKARKLANRNSVQLSPAPVTRSAHARRPVPRAATASPRSIPASPRAAQASPRAAQASPRAAQASPRAAQASLRAAPAHLDASASPRPASSVQDSSQHDSTRAPSPPARRSLRSSARASPPPPPPRPPPARPAPSPPPSYAELTRRFALRSRSTPQNSPGPAAAPPSPPHKRRRLYNPNA